MVSAHLNTAELRVEGFHRSLLFQELNGVLKGSLPLNSFINGLAWDFNICATKYEMAHSFLKKRHQGERVLPDLVDVLEGCNLNVSVRSQGPELINVSCFWWGLLWQGLERGQGLNNDISGVRGERDDLLGFGQSVLYVEQIGVGLVGCRGCCRGFGIHSLVKVDHRDISFDVAPSDLFIYRSYAMTGRHRGHLAGILIGRNSFDQFFRPLDLRDH